jgi:Ca-activated chloride channel homolog
MLPAPGTDRPSLPDPDARPAGPFADAGTGPRGAFVPRPEQGSGTPSPSHEVRAMRRIALAALALAAGTAACGSSAASHGPGPAATAAPAHSWSTPRPVRPDDPAATPYDGVTYEDPGTNPYVPTTRDRESTFALDVDTASYAIARRYVDDGNLPDPASVRVEEFVNAFDQGYPSPEGGVFGIYADGGPSPFLTEHEVLVRIGIQAQDVSRRQRQDAALTFVIDTSGSMAREDRLELVKRSLAVLVDQLRPSDSVAIVSYGTDARVVLEPTTARDRGRILGALDELTPDGSTNAEAGLRLGYRLAADHLLEGGINRVILASDGVANTGNTDAATILDRIAWDASLGIQLVSVGFGMGNYNDVLMEQLADNGDGFYAYVNTIDDATTLFRDRLVSTLDTVALDARVQVEFNPQVVEAYRLIGYENRAIDDGSFRDDTVDAGAIGAGHASTALYAVRPTYEGERSGRIATVSLRWIDPVTRLASEISRDVRMDDLAGSFRDTAAAFRLDALVAATAERLRDSRWSAGHGLRDIASAASDMAGDLPRTDEVTAFLDLLSEAARLER